jgi:sugar phosphate isomerase/epimerase
MVSHAQLCLASSPSADIPLEREIEIAAQAGFRCVDLDAIRLDTFLDTYPVAWLEMLLQQHRVYVMAISGGEPFPASPLREDDLVWQAHFLVQCARLDALGGGTVSVRAAPYPLGPLQGQTIPDVVRTLRHLASLAAPFDVRLALEIQGDAETEAIMLRAGQEIVQRTARSNILLALDVPRLLQSGCFLQDIDKLDIGRLAIVRLGDPLLGTSDPTSLPALCARLRANGYLGPYSVQLDAGSSQSVEKARMARQEIELWLGE